MADEDALVRVFSNPKYYEKTMTNFDKLNHKTKDSVLSGTFFHGTDIKNLKHICKHGLKRGDACHVGDISIHDPLIGSDRIYDCIGNVSLARDRKPDVLIFVLYLKGKENKMPTLNSGFVVDGNILDPTGNIRAQFTDYNISGTTNLSVITDIIGEWKAKITIWNGTDYTICEENIYVLGPPPPNNPDASMVVSINIL